MSGKIDASFPNPVLLSDGDDYLKGCNFSLEIDEGNITVDESGICIPVSYALQSDTLCKLVKEGKAVVAASSKSPSASFSQLDVFDSGASKEVLKIGKYSVLNRIDIQGVVIASAAFRLRGSAVVRVAYHAVCEMLAECCPDAAHIMEEAESDALTYLDFPPSHWKRLRTNNLQERTNREIKRRSRVVQVFLSEKSLERLVGAVLCDVDEEWGRPRYSSEDKMAELYANKPAPEPLGKGWTELRAIAKQATEVDLRLADEMEAA